MHSNSQKKLPRQLHTALKPAWSREQPKKTAARQPGPRDKKTRDANEPQKRHSKRAFLIRPKLKSPEIKRHRTRTTASTGEPVEVKYAMPPKKGLKERREKAAKASAASAAQRKGQ